MAVLSVSAGEASGQTWVSSCGAKPPLAGSGAWLGRADVLPQSCRARRDWERSCRERGTRRSLPDELLFLNISFIFFLIF